MAITTFLHEHESNDWVKLSDPELNELFQEVRQKVSDRLRISENTIERKRFLRKSTCQTFYTIYIECGKPEYQVMNFYSDGLNSSSINTHISKAVLMAYFYGMLYNRDFLKD